MTDVIPANGSPTIAPLADDGGASPSTSTGRSASPNAPIATSTSHVREQVDQDAWRDALLADLAHEAAQTPGRRLTSIFFGGGTPSLMPPATVAALIEAAERHWGFAAGIEITLEANPSSVEAARFADLARAGVNRVSLGLQSLDDAALQLPRPRARRGRGADGARHRPVGVRPGQLRPDLRPARPERRGLGGRARAGALGFGTGHLSLYQLTIEPGTRFAALAAKGELVPADPDESAALYELTQEMTGAAGLPAYEISNHARPGEESRHNLAYWRYQTYAGVGPGAHGRRGGRATQRHRKPENWLVALARNGHGIVEETRDRARRAAASRRCSWACASPRASTSTLDGAERSRRLDRASTALAAQGLLDTQTAIGSAPTPRGMLLLDAILPRSPSVEVARRRRDHGRARRRHLAHLQRPVRHAVAAEAEGAVDARKAVRIPQRPRREGAADLPVRRDPHGEQHRIIAERGQPERRGIVAGAVAGAELVVDVSDGAANQAPRSATLAPILPSRRPALGARAGAAAARRRGAPARRAAIARGTSASSTASASPWREQAGRGGAHAGGARARRSGCRPAGRRRPPPPAVIARAARSP